MQPLNEQEAEALRKRAAESASADVPAKEPAVEAQPAAVTPVPGLIFGSGAPSPSPAVDPGVTPEKVEVDDWVTVWAPKVAEYFREQRASKQIKGVQSRFPGFATAFDTLEQALVDPAVAAADCRAALVRVRAACRKPGAHENASSFPTGTETNVLELVNVKLLWKKGDRSLSPGVTVRTKNKQNVVSDMKPDYATPSPGVVGDHVRVAKPGATVDKLLGYIADDTKDKLTTYPALRVRVLVDVIPSGAGARTLAEDPVESRKAVAARMKKEIPAEILNRLARADVLLSDTVVVVIEPADLT